MAQLPPCAAAIALHRQDGRIFGARIGVDWSSVRPAPCDQLVGIDEHALDFDAFLAELDKSPVHAGSPFLEGVIDVIEDCTEARIIFRPKPEYLENLAGCHSSSPAVLVGNRVADPGAAGNGSVRGGRA